MSTLFSIGEDELDLEDEDCLLAACGEGILDNSKTSRSNPNKASFQTQFLRTKEVEKLDSCNPRCPFESISNKNTGERSCDKKRDSTEQLWRGTSLKWPVNRSLSTSSELNIPMAKRLAIESTYDSFSKSSVSENGQNLLHSSSMPTFKNTGNSSCSRNSLNSQVQELQPQKRSNSCVVSNRVDSSVTITGISDSTKKLLPRKDFSGSHKFSCMDLQNSKAANINSYCNKSVWQQKRPLTGSPTISIGQSNFHTGEANTVVYNQPEGWHANFFNKKIIGAKPPEAPTCTVPRKVVRSGPRTPQGYKPITPVANKSLARTQSCSKTPKTRKFPGPAGLLPKLSPGQNLDDPSFASPLPTAGKPSPVQSKVSQSSSSEDEEFSQDPWTYMYQDFLRTVPLAMRYTIIRVYTEAIQQRLEHGKVPCLCALVKAFSLTDANASVLLKDPTGEIHGTLHRKVLENYQTELAPGAGLMLKHVSVFSPAPRKHYLNITPGNILHIYPPDPQHMSSSQALASQCTQAEGKKEEHRRVCEVEPISRQVDCNKQQTKSAEKSNQEESWTQKDCFEDLLDGLDDDQDLLDDALLV